MKQVLKEKIQTFLEIYKTFGEAVAWSWLDKELEKLDKKK